MNFTEISDLTASWSLIYGIISIAHWKIFYIFQNKIFCDL